MEKVKKAKELGDVICPDEIEDLFVSEYRKSDNERVYQSLFLFSKKYLLESKNILSAELKIDIMFYFGYIDYYQITSNEYNFTEASMDSTLAVEGVISFGTFRLNASGKNCDKLWNIVNKYIKPNVYSEREIEEVEEE